MHRSIALTALLALTACDPVDLQSIEMSPRAQSQNQREVAFVQTLFNDIQPSSIAQDREYCGLIGITADGALTATRPRRGRVSSCLPPIPSSVGFEVIASYHTHGSSSLEYLTEIPSFEDMRTDIEDDTDGYIATPGGRLWYVDARRRVARQICGLNCLVQDVNHREDPDFPVRQTYTLDELRAF